MTNAWNLQKKSQDHVRIHPLPKQAFWIQVLFFQSLARHSIRPIAIIKLLPRFIAKNPLFLHGISFPLSLSLLIPADQGVIFLKRVVWAIDGHRDDWCVAN